MGLAEELLLRILFAIIKKERQVISYMENKLTRIQFDILESLVNSNNKLTNNYATDKIHETINELNELGYMLNEEVTNSGIEVLENYRAKRAVFIAAGFGSRLMPITINTPKPLVRVNGKRMIDGLIDACLEIGINEIYIVRGYLAEQFDQLLYKYPMIKFIENPIYNEANNISSTLAVRELLSNAYVFEADLLISNPAIIKKYHYTSDFLAIKKDETADWCFTVENGVITEEKIGGTDCWQMVGISYWNEEDGKKLYRDIEVVYNSRDGKKMYWEQVPLVCCKENYSVEVRECFEDDIVEIDTFNELKAIDKIYDCD